MAKQSIVGSGSYMPESAYLRKMEQTCIYEDPLQLNNHFRNTLRDYRPDAPLFESDQARRPENNYSMDRLNLRHGGARTLDDPYLPDGTFIDYDFLQKDPRGIAVEPDMRKHREQQEARGKFIKHGIDSDDSVPSDGRHPAKVNHDIKSQFYRLKDQWKIFDESEYGWHNGGTTKVKQTGQALCMQKTTDKAPELRDEACSNRQNAVHSLSNDTSIGWRRTTDHVFKVAQYGQVRPLASINIQNWTKNRGNSKLDHDILLSWKDQNVPKSLALKMIDLTSRRKADLEAGKSLQFQQSTKQDNRARMIVRDDLEAQNATKTTHAQSLLSDNQLVFKSAPKPKADNNLTKKTIIDPIVFDFICSINQKMAPRDMKDLRENVKRSCEARGLLTEATTKGKGSLRKLNRGNEGLWKSKADWVKGSSLKVANYSQCRAIKDPNRLKSLDGDQYHGISHFNAQRRGRLTNDAYDFENVEHEVVYGEEADRVKIIGKMGSKNIRHGVDKNDIEQTLTHELNDL